MITRSALQKSKFPHTRPRAADVPPLRSDFLLCGASIVIVNLLLIIKIIIVLLLLLSIFISILIMIIIVLVVLMIIITNLLVRFPP